jgi:hypothetical protein
MIFKKAYTQLIGCLLILSSSSCTNTEGNDRFAGFEKIIDVNHVSSVSGRSTGQIIDLNIPPDQEINFDYNKNLYDLRFVKLERTPASVIGKIDKLFFSASRIVVVDLNITESIFIFDSSGHFLNKISTDKYAKPDAQNDLTHIFDVAYYYNKDEIIVHDNRKAKSYYFDSNGNFLRVEREYISFFSFANLKNTDYFVYIDLYTGNDHIPALKKSEIYLGREGTRITYTAPDAVQRIMIKANYHYTDNLSLSNSSNGFYTPVFSDTVYLIDGKKPDVYPKFVLHFPGHDINAKVKESPQTIDMPLLTQLYNTHAYYSFQGKVLAAGDSVYYIECNKGKQLGYFYSERTNKIIGGTLQSRLSYKDSAQLQAYQYPIASTGTEFVSMLSPEDLISQAPMLRTVKFSRALENLSRADNPVLVFYKLKNF